MSLLRRVVPFVSFTTLTAFSAASCQPTGDTFDRTTLLTTTSRQVIVPTYESLATNASALSAATQAFCTTQDQTTLDAVQLAWSETMREYEVAQAFAFGPYRTGFYESKLNSWPVDVAKVDAVRTDATVDLTFLAPVQEGLSSFEYLTFDPVGGDAAILAAFADATLGARRCAYVQQIATDEATGAAALRDAWTSNGGYQTGFETAGSGSTTYSTSSAAIADVVNHLVFAVQDAREMRLGAPVGRPGGVTGDMLGHPELVESRFSDRSLQDLLDILDGIEAIYRGGFGNGPTPAADGGAPSGLGLRDYLLTKRGGATTDAAILAQIDATRVAVNAITPTLREAATASPSPGAASGESAILAAYDAFRALETTFSTNLAGALAVTIVAPDTDGD